MTNQVRAAESLKKIEPYLVVNPDDFFEYCGLWYTQIDAAVGYPVEIKVDPTIARGAVHLVDEDEVLGKRVRKFELGEDGDLL